MDAVAARFLLHSEGAMAALDAERYHLARTNAVYMASEGGGARGWQEAHQKHCEKSDGKLPGGVVTVRGGCHETGGGGL